MKNKLISILNFLTKGSISVVLFVALVLIGILYSDDESYTYIFYTILFLLLIQFLLRIYKISYYMYKEDDLLALAIMFGLLATSITFFIIAFVQNAVFV